MTGRAPEDRVEGIRRAPRRQAYENLPLLLIRDKTISYRALGVLVRLLSNADNFRMPSTALAQERKEGREAVRAALRELEAAGYIKRERTRNSRGQCSWRMVVFETPQTPAPSGVKSQSADFRASVSRTPENRSAVSRATKNSITNSHYQEKTTATDALIWDSLPQLDEKQRMVVLEKLEGLNPELQQDVLDELAGGFIFGTIKKGWLGWLNSVVQKAREGTFVPNLALVIQSKRKRQKGMSQEERREHLGLPPLARIASRDVAEAAMAEIRSGLSTGDST